jgi:hypothetical protein
MDQSESPDMPPEPPDIDDRPEPTTEETLDALAAWNATQTSEETGSLTDLVGPLSMKLAEIISEHRDDFDALIGIYADAKRAIQILNVIASEAETAAIPHIPWETGPRGGKYRGKITVDGVGTFSASSPAMKTVWDDTTMRRAIKAAWERGDINSPIEAADVAMSVLYGGTQFRKRALDELGLDVKSLNTAEYGATRLRWL